jgi:hypothetical protein
LFLRFEQEIMSPIPIYEPSFIASSCTTQQQQEEAQMPATLMVTLSKAHPLRPSADVIIAQLHSITDTISSM